jgi:hypothetical protein
METVRRQICRMEPESKTRIGVDNMVVYWCLKRGRSFCWELNEQVRRIGGDANARKLELEFMWVPTEKNKADWVSRQWKRPSGNGPPMDHEDPQHP